ncbi:hypothetical protein HYFRA_00003937 [Hymenoscyphus fraxineus]|uniref:Uncharacterized protein n=1 Tax=Hymenoscyphus fraxineus TaxID=746836 RepID=A0A9N9L1N4_9HELO|nr:hypothetical protein HYFRA_00003937 [Hymenoscyphus fraxineus]
MPGKTKKGAVGADIPKPVSSSPSFLWKKGINAVAPSILNGWARTLKSYFHQSNRGVEYHGGDFIVIMEKLISAQLYNMITDHSSR